MSKYYKKISLNDITDNIQDVIADISDEVISKDVIRLRINQLKEQNKTTELIFGGSVNDLIEKAIIKELESMVE